MICPLPKARRFALAALLGMILCASGCQLFAPQEPQEPETVREFVGMRRPGIFDSDNANSGMNK